MRKIIKNNQQAELLRSIILKSKAFVGWKKKTSEYKNVKNFIINKLCVQKMTSKVKIFSALKHNWRASKEADHKWKLALGHRAISLLKNGLKSWHLKAHTAKKVRTNFVKIQVKNHRNIKSQAFKQLRNRFKHEYSINRSLEQRVALLKRNKREKIFREMVETVDDSLFEKSLEKRSQFFFGYWGAREFFKKAFLYTSMKKQERINIEKADNFRLRKLLGKSFYTLVEYYNHN